MNALDAPYHFVPLSEHVQLPDWSSEVSLDIPFSDGLNGVLEIAIEALSPLCIGDKHRKANDREPGRVRFYRLPDGTPAIPGSSLRGMIRNVMEIACFGRMSLIDDRRFGLRDLTGAAKEDYTRALVNKSKAGWLSFDKTLGCEGWKIEPCAFGRVTHDIIIQLGQLDYRDFSAPRTSAEQKYSYWEGHQKKKNSLRVALDKGPPRPTNQDEIFDWRIPSDRPGEVRKEGTLVFTGQPNTKKRREFFFLDPSGTVLDVPPAVWRAFTDIHEDQHESAEWAYWRRQYFSGGKRIPVFYIEEQGEITALGLAMMFKLAGKYSTHDLRNDLQSPASAERSGISDNKVPERLDLVEAIFGRVGATPADALRSRISFGTAVLANPDAVTFEAQKPTVLGSPKPSYFPTYLRQPLGNAEGTRLPNNDNYRTYMKKAELAGWKRYPVHGPGDPTLPSLNAANTFRKNVQIVLETLKARGNEKPRFTSKLRFHNLRPVELGAILWALRFGERDTLCHSIGMAKAHGFGQVGIKLAGTGMRTELTCNDGAKLTADECLQSFCAHMEDWAGKTGIPRGWEGSLQIQRLRAMADPAEAQNWPGRLRHMTLDPKARPRAVNEFVEAKRARLVLAPYGDPTLEADRRPLRAPPEPIPDNAHPPLPPAHIEQEAPTTFARVLLPKGKKVEFAGEVGRLNELLREGMAEVEVDFDGDIESVPLSELTVLPN